MPARRRALLIPEDLRVHVGVPVDEPGRDHVAFGVKFAFAAFVDDADLHDATVVDRDVTVRRWRA